MRRRILIAAHAVCPHAGSEAGMGWNIVYRLAASHEVLVLCNAVHHDSFGFLKNWDCRREIESFTAHHGLPDGLKFVFVDPPILHRLLHRESFPLRQSPLFYIGYAAWQRAAYRVAVELHKQRPFDLVHQLNITGFRDPGHLWQLGCPFVWGPITGTQTIPWSFLKQFSTVDRLYYSARNMANGIQVRSKQSSRAAARRSQHIWVVAESDRKMVCELWGCSTEKVEIMLETGTNILLGVSARAYNPSRPLRVCWSGAHLGRKALPILLHAIDRCQSPSQVELSVLGEGAETDRWKKLAKSLSSKPSVRWLGRLEHGAAIAEMNRSDIFVLSSLQEATSTVVMEALSLGLPVLCHDACGMAQAVTLECGIKIHLSDPQTSIAGFAAALDRFLQHPEEVERLSQGALQRAKELTWDSKVQTILSTYARICGQTDRSISLRKKRAVEVSMSA